MSYQIKETTDPSAVVVLSPRDGMLCASLMRDGRSERLGSYAPAFARIFLSCALRSRGLALAA